MGNSQNQLLAGKAYALFLSELKSHLNLAKERFHSKKDVNLDDCEKTRSSFHTIKGGAGFFGLTEVAEAASKIESLFSKPVEDLIKQIDSVRGELLKIEELSKTLPKAKGQ